MDNVIPFPRPNVHELGAYQSAQLAEWRGASRWPPRRSFLFIAAASLLCWSVLLAPLF